MTVWLVIARELNSCRDRDGILTQSKFRCTEHNKPYRFSGEGRRLEQVNCKEDGII
jgi:hypothetical protein